MASANMEGIRKGVEEAQKEFPRPIKKKFPFVFPEGVQDVEWTFRRLRCDENKVPYMETERKLEIISRDDMPKHSIITIDEKSFIQFKETKSEIGIMKGDIIKSAEFQNLPPWDSDTDAIETLVHNLEKYLHVQSLVVENIREDLKSDIVLISIEATTKNDYDCFK